MQELGNQSNKMKQQIDLVLFGVIAEQGNQK
jgi:hypothetical protein